MKLHWFRGGFSPIRLLSAGAVVAMVAIIYGVFPTLSVRASYPVSSYGSLTSIAAAPGGGYWVQVDARSSTQPAYTRSIDGAPDLGSIDTGGTIMAVPGRNAFLVVSKFGRIFAAGNVTALCGGQVSGCSSYPTNPSGSQRIVGATITPDREGMWVITANRKVYALGDAKWYGDVNDSKVPVAILSTPTGKGYYVVNDDGGVFTFGDAKFFGSTGGKRPSGRYITGMALSLNAARQVNGYWLVGEDGGIYSFGDAPFLGSSGGKDKLVVTGITSRQEGRSYAWVNTSGQVTQSQTAPNEVIANRYSELAMGVDDKALEARVKQYTPSTTDRRLQWEIWRISPQSNLVQLRNAESGLCLQMAGVVYASTMIQGTCKTPEQGRDDQLFILHTDGAIHQFGSYIDDNFRLGVTSTDEGAQVKLIFYGGVSNYKTVSWLFTDVR